jgi:hypothetical protein
VGTRLDDCKTCHTGGNVTRTSDLKVLWKDACVYCHYIPFPPTDPEEKVNDGPTAYVQTLNPYGLDYLNAGRDGSALRKIAVLDSDTDGFSNLEEIKDLRYPGNPNSFPGQPLCPMLTVTLAEIKKMPAHTQFMLANTSSQQWDFYATYTGVKLKDLFAELGVDLTGATGVDILAPDGFGPSFTLDDINLQFPQHRFFPGFGVDPLGTDCGFVEYPTETYGYGYGEVITDEQWHLLAYERDGLPLEPSYPDFTSGKIGGEGPLRNAYPPYNFTEDAMNQPDCGKNADTVACPLCAPAGLWKYDGSKAHNAPKMVKGTVALAIQPMPACEEPDILSGGWSLIEDEELIIYGHNIAGP